MLRVNTLHPYIESEMKDFCFWTKKNPTKKCQTLGIRFLCPIGVRDEPLHKPILFGWDWNPKNPMNDREGW